MLDERGQFNFCGELLDLVEQLWCSYTATHGEVPGARERLVGLTYIVAALRQDADLIRAQLLGAAALQGLDVAGPLQRELGAPDAEQVAAVRAELERRGWPV